MHKPVFSSYNAISNGGMCPSLPFPSLPFLSNGGMCPTVLVSATQLNNNNISISGGRGRYHIISNVIGPKTSKNESKSNAIPRAGHIALPICSFRKTD